MKTELRELIEAHRSKASELIPQLSNALGFKLPITNAHWVGLDIPHRGNTSDGRQYFKHGYGVAIKYNGGEIDIDFGSKGEYDGWRLFRFAEEGSIKTPYKDYRQVEIDISGADSKGQLQCSGYILYYHQIDDR